LKRSYALWTRRLGRAAGIIALPMFISACAVSHFSNPFRTSSPDTAAPLPPPPGTEDRLFGTAKPNTDSHVGGANYHCPQVVAWPNDRLLTIYEAGHVGDSLFIIHRGEITKLSRDCQLSPDRVVVRYGFAGRVLLGPKGTAATVILPISIRVANADHKTLVTDAVKITTTIPQGEPAGYFSMVKEVSFPITVGTRPEDYKVFVAFEHNQPGAG
jgi:hypothetical protein